MPNPLNLKSNSSLIFILLIIVISIYLLRDDLLGNKVQFAGDGRDQFLADKTVIRNSVLKGVLPLWSPFLMSGEPIFAKPQLGVISINTLLEFIAPNVYFSWFLNVLIHLVILGIGMFLLARTINLEPKFAFVAAIVCMLSSYVASSLFYANYQFSGLAFAPYVLMFTLKGIKSSLWLKYAIYAGLFLSFEFLEGALEVFTFTAMIVAYILLFNLIGKGFVNRLIKLALFGAVLLAVAIGVSAIKLLPSIELASLSQRQQPYDFETSLGTHITAQDFFQTLVESRSLSAFFQHPIKGTGRTEIGIVGAIMVLASIMNLKKRNYLLFLGMLIFGLLMITNSPLVYFLWKYFPYFNKQKHVIKAQIIFLLAASVLVAYGVYYIVSKIKDKKIASITYTGIIILLVVTSWGFTYDVKLRAPDKEIDSVEIMRYMGNERSQAKEMFRFKAYETNGIDWGTNYYSITYGLHDIYGYVNLWLLDYLPIFLSVANREPAKLFGMLNMKYMSSMQELNISGFRLVKRFDEPLRDCQYNPDATIVDFYRMENCPPYVYLKKAWGPYLYINERLMPRAYLVDKAALIVGKKDIAKQIAYQLMLDSNFNPSNNAIIIGKGTINQYTPEELKQYSVIFLTEGSIDQNSIGLLRGYKDSGGMILPDVLDGKNAMTQENVNEMWKIFAGNHTKAEYALISYNHYKANVPTKGNFLVLSEKFSVYPGWKAESNGKILEILNANVMNSAVYTGSETQDIDFVYRPLSFVKGALITIGSMLIIGGYLGFPLIKKRKVDKSAPVTNSL